mmetsp:Transcript_21887/g.30449  ORF Transcript_21887/g.30449 Transcript_21887/m.30449 type:complete len:168 (+) Transcript_21887:221-724(+)
MREEGKLNQMQSELACAVPHFLWSSVYGSVFGEGPDKDAFATTMWTLNQRRLKREKLVEVVPIPIFSTCLNNTIKDSVRQRNKNLMQFTWGHNHVGDVLAQFRSAQSVQIFSPPPPAPPLTPEVTGEAGLQGLCRYPCSGIPQERVYETKHLPWTPRGAACQETLPC